MQSSHGPKCMLQIVGDGHSFSQSGGVAFGTGNKLMADGAAVLGGIGNTASGQYSTVSGGTGNTAPAFASLNGKAWNAIYLLSDFM